MLRLAKFISIAGHPIFAPAYGVFIILQYHMVIAAKVAANYKLMLFIMLILMFSIMPLLGVMFIMRKHSPKELAEINQKERSYAAWILTIIYAVIAFYLDDYFVHPFFKLFAIALASSSAVLAVMTRYLKLSFHAFGWAGLLVLTGVISLKFNLNMLGLIALIILASGIVMTSRLLLKAHTRLEVYSGFITGLICNIAVYIIFNGRF